MRNDDIIRISPARFHIEAALGPKPNDKEYSNGDELKISLILRADSYKFFHSQAYAPNIIGMSSYGEARVSKNVTIVPFGLQLLIKKYLTQRITVEDVKVAQEFSKNHFGRELFAYDAWMKVALLYDGYLPLTIRAVPEGTPVTGGVPLYTVTCTDPDLFWMSAYFETLIQRAFWYPTTITSLDYDIKQEIKRFYRISGADTGLLPFSLHDFGGRGVTCGEQAEIGGAAHLVNFMGSDTVEGIVTANHYYNEPMAAFSVAATEHSVECSFGLSLEGERAYLEHVLSKAPAGSIISIVIDGRDVLRCARELCTTFRDKIIASGAKVVFRPDSGDMLEIVPKILQMQAQAFGHDVNAAGFMKVKTVGIIQGDGVDHMAIKTLLGNIVAMGYSADNVIFGSGGALLQKVNRDTFKFAQKASAIQVKQYYNEAEPWMGYGLEWKGIAKDPVTDPGKKSKEGVLTLARNKKSGELVTVRLDEGPLSNDLEDMHQLVYQNGKLFNETTLAEVRARAQ